MKIAGAEKIDAASAQGIGFSVAEMSPFSPRDEFDLIIIVPMQQIGAFGCQLPNFFRMVKFRLSCRASICAKKIRLLSMLLPLFVDDLLIVYHIGLCL